MEVIQSQFSKQIESKTISKKEMRKQREQFIIKQEAEKRKPFEQLMQGEIYEEEELMKLQQLHYQFRKEGYYISIFEKYPEGTMHHKWKKCCVEGWNVDSKELKDVYYTPIVMLLKEIKKFNAKNHDSFDCSPKGFYAMIKYSLSELRHGCNFQRSSMNDEIQKLILGDYSFIRYVNYKQRIIVCNREKKFVDIMNADTSIVPIPTFPIVRIPDEPIEIFIPRNWPLTLSPINKYETPMDYYISVIDWCRRHTQYDDPEVLRIAFRMIIGNEIVLEECLRNMEYLGQFIRHCNRMYRYMMKYFNYEETLKKEDVKCERYELMKKSSRVLNLWKYPKEVGSKIYILLKFLDENQIREMYENPKHYLNWLKENVSDYSTNQVIETIQHFGYTTF